MGLDQLEVDYVMDQVKKWVEKGAIVHKKDRELRAEAKKATASRQRYEMP